MNSPLHSIRANAMKIVALLLNSKPLNLVTGISMACAWGLFCYAHLLAFQRSGDWAYLLFCASESLVALLFLIRSDPVEVSTAPLDWLVAISCTAAPFLLAPASSALLPEARLLIVAGVLIQVTGLLSLNRSFGLVAAQRDIKTGGLYRLVRHPLYASYLLSYCGYVLSNSSLSNLAVGLLGAVLLLWRLHREERFLSRDARYRVYMRQVKYRVIPLLY